jgi:fructoselysine-6-phosphate deglycase
MLNFDVDRFLEIQSGAVALGTTIDETVAESLRGGATNVHLVGAGGAAILLQPCVQLLRRSSNFPVFSDPIAETAGRLSRRIWAVSFGPAKRRA